MVAIPRYADDFVQQAEPIVGQEMTDDEFARLPKFTRKYELIHGVIKMSPAGLRHDNVAAKLIMRLGMYLIEHPIGEFYATSAGFQVSPNVVLSSDGAFVSHERLQGKVSPDAFGAFAPDLAVEIVSPGDSATEVDEKVQLYLSNGTQLLWVINPRLRFAMVYRANGSVQRLQASDALDGENVLPDFVCNLSDIL